MAIPPDRPSAEDFPPRLERPVLLVVVDTEEEFDWSRPFDRGSTSVTAMREIHRGQEICEEYDVRPCYAVDYPVAYQEEGYGPLAGPVAAGRAVLAAHLHPWVTPPFEEPVDAYHSYAGNLAPELEEAKITHLTERIEASFGFRPRVYKAGRYGFGPNTPSILHRLGFQVDLSPAPPFDLSADGGPDFSRTPVGPRRIGPGDGLLSFPRSGAHVGYLGALGATVYRLAGYPVLNRLRLRGALARLGAVERLALSPEDCGAQALIRLVRWLLRRGERVFSLSFHSPSLAPGHTPYVRSRGDLEDLLDTLRRFFDFFLGELGGEALTPLELRERLLGGPYHTGPASAERYSSR